MTDFPTAAEFRGWLEAQPQSRVIARDWGPDDCPIAQCLHARGLQEAAVSMYEWRPRWGFQEKWRPTPKFARDFVERIDRRTTPGITPRGCLAILRRVAPEAFED